MVATISADIVHSTSLSSRDMLSLRDKLYGLFDDFEKEYPGFWARIVRGDGIECFVPEYRDVLRIALLIKLFVKVQVYDLDCDFVLRRHGVRFSIGIADIDYANKAEDLLNGPAISISGRNLDKIGRKGDTYTAFEASSTHVGLSTLMDSYVAMLGNFVDSYSVKQAEVVFYKLLGMKETEISRRLGIYQSSVNTRSTSAQWGLFHTAIRDFENFVF